MSEAATSITIGSDAKKRLEEAIRTALSTRQEIADLRDSLKDLIANVAEEVGIDKKILTEAINTAEKNALSEKKDKLDQVQYVLEVTGYA